MVDQTEDRLNQQPPGGAPAVKQTNNASVSEAKEKGSTAFQSRLQAKRQERMQQRQANPEDQRGMAAKPAAQPSEEQVVSGGSKTALGCMSLSCDSFSCLAMSTRFESSNREVGVQRSRLGSLLVLDPTQATSIPRRPNQVKQTPNDECEPKRDAPS